MTDLPTPAPDPQAPPPPPPAAQPASQLPTPPGPPPRRRIPTTRWIIIGVVVALIIVGGIASVLARQNSRFTIVPSSSTDGTFSAGDCVTLTSTTVHAADCGQAHDAQIIQVIHGSQTCPSGTQEFDVVDNTGNLCLDKGNHSS